MGPVRVMAHLVVVAAPGSMRRDGRERMGDLLTNTVGRWAARHGIAGSGIRTKRVLHAGLKDLERCPVANMLLAPNQPRERVDCTYGG
jgi:hypothetical protein